MRLKTTYADLRPGDRFDRTMNRWEVLEVGDRLPGDTRRPIHVRQTKTGEKKIFNIRDHAEVFVTRTEEEAS